MSDLTIFLANSEELPSTTLHAEATADLAVTSQPYDILASTPGCDPHAQASVGQASLEATPALYLHG